ncbi:hypothetical protein V7S43_011534 [Phytophthora oleae]|uniref:PiggyBac transposable element-derived protein domain-containing protein n=1 Tax=Phytophthora oleae TaxID=2107226 RepID=A0ABD3F9U2_9STRA
MIHLRVESVSRRRLTPEDGNVRTAEEAVDRYNKVMSRKRKAMDHTAPFSKCDKTLTDDMHKYITTEDYTQEAEQIPAVYVEDINREYAKNMMARGVPWRHMQIRQTLCQGAFVKSPRGSGPLWFGRTRVHQTASFNRAKCVDYLLRFRKCC